MHLLITILGFGNAVKVRFPGPRHPAIFSRGERPLKHTAYVLEVPGEEAEVPMSQYGEQGVAVGGISNARESDVRSNQKNGRGRELPPTPANELSS